MHPFRHSGWNAWSGVFSAMEEKAPEAMEEGPAPPSKTERTAETLRAPISWGELIDKITILEIKAAEIASEAALANVRKELALLNSLAGGEFSRSDIGKLKSDLKGVNAALWKIEDAIRDKERLKAFDAEFIDLARSVYKRNDERALIKRRINTLMASDIIEEKSYRSY